MESLKHVANVPETVFATKELIEEGKLLQAHRNLADLEASRDQLLLELHRQMNRSANPDPKNENDAKVSSLVAKNIVYSCLFDSMLSFLQALFLL